jgi:hypothetical protein
VSKSSNKDTLAKLKQTVGSSKKSIAAAAMIADFFSNNAGSVMGRYILGEVFNGARSLVNNSKDSVPYSLGTSVINVDQTKVHIIRFDVGRPSTKSVLEAEKMHGSSNIQISNSLSDNTSTESRSYLSKSFGFNQKSMDFLYGRFYVRMIEYEKLYNILKWEIPDFCEQVPYGLAKEEYANLKIRNSNTYHKIKFKVHRVKINDDDVDNWILYGKVVNQITTKQSDGCIPKVYQITDIEKSNQYLNSVLLYAGATLNMSSNFKTQATIVKTFSKTLNPGDTLDFRMKNHLGPGIRFDIAKSYILGGAAKGDQPSSYSMIVEAEGTPCEGMRTIDKSVFQGTSSGYYNYEYKTGITVVRNSPIVSNPTDLGEGFDNKYAVRIYTREFLKVPPISFAADSIGKPGEPNKEFVIMSTSREEPVYSSNIFGAAKQKAKEDHQEIDTDFDIRHEDEEDFND